MTRPMQVRTLPPELTRFRDAVMVATRALNADVLVRVQVPELQRNRTTFQGGVMVARSAVNRAVQVRFLPLELHIRRSSNGRARARLARDEGPNPSETTKFRGMEVVYGKPHHQHSYHPARESAPRIICRSCPVSE